MIHFLTGKIHSILQKAHLLRYASALAAHVPLKYAPLLDPRDALQLNLFEQSVKMIEIFTIYYLLSYRRRPVSRKCLTNQHCFQAIIYKNYMANIAGK